MEFTTLIDATTLESHLGDSNWVVVDCRFDLMQPDAGRRAYEDGHIPGAVYADLNLDLSSVVTETSGRHPLPDPEVFAAWLGNNGIGNDSQVVAYDASSCSYAVRLWWLLRWLGHRAVAVLDGGFAAWQKAGYTITEDVPLPVSTTFTGRPDRQMYLDMNEVRQQLAEHRITLVDARTAARFNGDVEPIDPVAGHVPGAVNLPLEDNLDSDGRFLSAESLRQRFADIAENPQRVVHMCGSGVTACHNILAMELAGLTGSKLYPGSWSEWCKITEIPVTKC